VGPAQNCGTWQPDLPKVVLFDGFSVGSEDFQKPIPQNPYGIRLSKNQKIGGKLVFSKTRKKLSFLQKCASGPVPTFPTVFVFFLLLMRP